MTSTTHSVVFHDVALKILQAGKPVEVISDSNLALPTQTMALIGESRQAAVAVIDLLCRRLVPQRGFIRFHGAVSWPIGHMAPFAVTVTGVQAISHFAVIYRFDRNHAIAFMKAEFAEPSLLTHPITTWPKALQTQFTLLMALIPDFAIYIVDTNLIMPDDITFSRRFLKLFNMRRTGQTTLITARQTRVLQALCQGALVVSDRRLYLEKDLEAALRLSNKIVNKDEAEEPLENEIIDDGSLF